jgi:ornithine carrier protein
MTTSQPQNVTMSKGSEGLPKVPKEAVKQTKHALLDALEDITFGSV